MKIIPKPAININEASIILNFCLTEIFSLPFICLIERPEMYDKYAGMRGNTQGLKNVKTPARKLTKYGADVKSDIKDSSMIKPL